MTWNHPPLQGSLERQVPGPLEATAEQASGLGFVICLATMDGKDMYEA
jgi:hypothetical protein